MAMLGAIMLCAWLYDTAKHRILANASVWLRGVLRLFA
jgi:hypothetical protein